MKESIQKNYFKTQQSSAPGIGTGLEIEMPYRQYWELDTLMRLLPKKRPLSFLEYGCGAGRWALSLGPIASSYIGVDLSANLLEHAREDAAKEGFKNITFIQSNIQDFVAEKNQSFDVIYAAGVLQYLNDDEIRALLKKANSWLTIDGMFVDRSTVVTERERLIRDSDGYFSIYRTPDELSSLFSEVGLHCIQQKRSYCYLRNSRLWRNRLVQYLTKYSMSKFPAMTFHAMKYLSFLTEMIEGQSGREADGVMYSHNFFVFQKKGERS